MMVLKLAAFASLLCLGLTGCAQQEYYPHHYSRVISRPRAPVIETSASTPTMAVAGSRAMAY
jgi:hypothetical protein